MHTIISKVELSFNNFKFRFGLIMAQYYWKYFNSMSQIIKIQKYETKFFRYFRDKEMETCWYAF